MLLHLMLRKKVLILMSDTGGGHRASAEAIETAFNEEFGDEYQALVFSNIKGMYFVNGLMEFEIPTAMSLVCILLSTFLAMKLLTKKSVIQIPGPKKLPLIGHLHLLVRNPLLHRKFTDLAGKYGPLIHLQLGAVPYIIVSSVAVAKQVLRTHDIIFSNKPEVYSARVTSYNRVDIGCAQYGEYWRHLRKICTLELLSMKRVVSFRQVREEENMNLAKGIASEAGSLANLSERLYRNSFYIISRTSIGNKPDEKAEIASTLEESLKLCSGFAIADLYPSVKWLPLLSGLKFKVDRIFQRTDRLLSRIVEKRRVAIAGKTDGTMHGTEALLDVLLKCQDDEAEVPLSTDAVKAVLLDLFVAGSDTSPTVVEWTMSELIRNPATMKKVQEEVRQVFDDKGYVDEADFDKLTYFRLVIKESMRMHPPLPLIVPRQSSHACEINGYEVPAKTTLIINAWALARDPEYWSDPEKFIPERFADSTIDYKGNNLEYLPFGGGRRMCPGMSFGIANVEFTLAVLLYHFDWEMPYGMKIEDLDMMEVFGATVRRKNGLHLIPILRRPLKMRN